MREILSQIKEWVLHLFTTHCDECRPHCENCDYLRLLIEQERAERSKLLSMMLEEHHESNDIDPYVNVKKYTPMKVRLQRLEAESREKARRERADVHASHG